MNHLNAPRAVRWLDLEGIGADRQMEGQFPKHINDLRRSPDSAGVSYPDYRGRGTLRTHEGPMESQRTTSSITY